MTAEEHRLWNIKLRADMVGRAASKAMSSQHLQQRVVDYERQIQVLQAALEMQREAEAAGDRRVEEAPATPSPRLDVSHAANAQPSSPPGLPSEYHRRTNYPTPLCSMEVQSASTPPMPSAASASSAILPSGHSAPSQDEGNQSGADKGQSVPVARKFKCCMGIVNRSLVKKVACLIQSVQRLIHPVLSKSTQATPLKRPQQHYRPPLPQLERIPLLCPKLDRCYA